MLNKLFEFVVLILLLEIKSKLVFLEVEYQLIAILCKEGKIKSKKLMAIDLIKAVSTSIHF